MRRENDFYPTPSWATRELMKRVWIRGVVVEPCVGAGDISRVLLEEKRIDGVTTNDLDRRFDAGHHEDATDWAFWRRLPLVDWVVTNPPFSVADKILPLAFKRATSGVAMLLRITYLEPCEGRGKWLAGYPPTTLIVLPRISFTGDGDTDSATCAWFVWDRDSCAQRIVVVNPVDERQGSLLNAVAPSASEL